MSIDISILVPDISAPSVGAAVRLRQLLEPYRTEIIGPDFGGGICSMYVDDGPFVAVPGGRMYRYPDYWRDSRVIDRAVSGRFVIAVKAFMNTVPAALRLQKRGIPCAVYLDEWDGSVLAEMSTPGRLLAFLRNIHHPMDDSFYPRVERMIPRADVVLSTTTFLQKRFGGHVVHMGVDTDWYLPQPASEVAELKEKLGLTGKKLIVFGGVVRPHKGVEQILEALVRLDREDIAFLVVGPVTEHLEDLKQHPSYGRYIKAVGAPLTDTSGINAAVHAKMPLYLDLADLIVLPLLDNALARSQMPIKLFEALAMGKPVIGSEVSDLPVILEGCGQTFPPGDISRLAESIERLADSPSVRDELGRAAREKAIKQFSKQAAGKHIRGIIGPFMR